MIYTLKDYKIAKHKQIAKRHKKQMYACIKCGKGSRIAGKRILLRGHYNPVEKSRRYPNLQWARIDGKRVRLCTQCIKTLAKPKVVRKKRTPAKAKA